MKLARSLITTVPGLGLDALMTACSCNTSTLGLEIIKNVLNRRVSYRHRFQKDANNNDGITQRQEVENSDNRHQVVSVGRVPARCS